MYKFNNTHLPICLSQLYERTGCSRPQYSSLSTGTKIFSNMSARVWNALSNKIDSNTSTAVLNNKLKLFLLNNDLFLFYPK